MEADPYLIRDDEDTRNLLSVFTCKAVTWDISPLPGTSDAELICDDEEQEFPTMTELILGIEELRYAFSFYM